MKQIEEYLFSLGMEKDEIQIYLLCLKYGQISITQLAKLVDKPRSSTYDKIQYMLKNQWIFLDKNFSNRDTYSAIDPEALLQLMKIKMEKMAYQYKEFEKDLVVFDQYKSPYKHLPKVRIHEGFESVLRIQMGTTFDEGYFIRNIDTVMSFLERDINTVFAYFSNNHTKLQKSLLIDTDKARAYVQLLEESRIKNNEIKLLPKSTYPISADSALVDGKYLHTSYDKRLIVIEINDQNLYNTMKMQFDILWEAM